jgi:ABC-type transporter Mla maintaining outer membrane lipid asymmetry ATPase subunit MlaF
MDKLGLSRSAENLYPDNLSSGMKRQVEIIRALINNPKSFWMSLFAHSIA